MNNSFTLPPPTREEFESLRQSILKHGIQDALIYTESGELIAGENRLKAAKELGIKEEDIPKKTILNRTPEEADELREELNVVGRQVSTDSKQKLARIRLLKDPSLSSRSVGDTLGLDKNTVQRLKDEMEAAGEFHQPHDVKGKDGKTYTKKPTKTAAGAEKAKAAVARKQKKQMTAKAKTRKKKKSKPTIATGTQVYEFNDREPAIHFFKVVRETEHYYCYTDGGKEEKVPKDGKFRDWDKCKKGLVELLRRRHKDAQHEEKKAQSLLKKGESLKQLPQVQEENK